MPTDNDWLRQIASSLSGAGGGGVTQPQVQSAIESAANLLAIQTKLSEIQAFLEMDLAALIRTQEPGGLIGGIPSVPSVVVGSPVEFFFVSTDNWRLFLAPPPGEVWQIDLVGFSQTQTVANSIDIRLHSDRAGAVGLTNQLASFRLYHPAFTGPNPVTALLSPFAAPLLNASAPAGGSDKSFYSGLPINRINGGQVLSFLAIRNAPPPIIFLRPV